MIEIIGRFDQRITMLIAQLPDSWRPLFVVITSLGDPIMTIGIGGVVVLLGWLQQNIRLALAGATVWVTLFIGSLIKLLVSRERPLTEYAANLRVDTFSFPSGHSSGAMVAYGLVAYLLWRILPLPLAIGATLICGLIIFAVGVSRIYLGAHFPSDVLAGWLLGGVALGVIILVIRPTL